VNRKSDIATDIERDKYVQLVLDKIKACAVPVTVFSPAESDAIEIGFMCEIEPAVTAAKIITNRRLHWTTERSRRLRIEGVRVAVAT
jgi:hypothetical protein